MRKTFSSRTISSVMASRRAFRNWMTGMAVGCPWSVVRCQWSVVGRSGGGFVRLDRDDLVLSEENVGRARGEEDDGRRADRDRPRVVDLVTVAAGQDDGDRDEWFPVERLLQFVLEAQFLAHVPLTPAGTD